MALLLLLVLAAAAHAQGNTDRSVPTGSVDTSEEFWQSNPTASVQSNQQGNDVLMVTMNRLLQDEEEQRRQKANEEAFQSLRKGLENWQGKPQHLRKANSHQALEKMQMNKISNKESAFQPQQYDPQQDLREAALIDQEDSPPSLDQQSKPKPKTSLSLSAVFYIVAAVVLTFFALKWAESCLRGAPRIQPQHEQAESLSTL